MNLLRLFALVLALFLASCGRDQEISEEQARGKVDFYQEITVLFDGVQDLDSAETAAGKVKELLAGLEEAHKNQEQVELDAEEKQEVAAITDESVEKMISATDQAGERVSGDAEAKAVVDSMIDELFQTLEKFEES